MPRFPRPRYRKDKDLWYVQINRRQHQLAKGKANKKEAERRYGLLMAAHPRAGVPLTVTVICALYREHARAELSESAVTFYDFYLSDFASTHPNLQVAALQPHHVTAWLKVRANTWKSTSTRHNAVAAVKRAFRWAEAEGYIEASPIRHVKLPAMGRRQRIMTEGEFQRALAVTPDREFRDFLIALRETGARPGRLAMLWAADLDFEKGTALPRPRAKDGKVIARVNKSKPYRPIYLNGPMMSLLRDLATQYQTGPLFRNSEGKAWSTRALGKRWEVVRRRAKLPADVVLYTLRHTFASDAITAGVSLAATAELLGHTDATVTARVYVHLTEKGAHLKDALAKVRPDPSSSASASSSSAPPPAPPGDRDGDG
jgi:site-specific recombinase XerD